MQRRRALLVGVWSYQRAAGAPGWRDLGSKNDVLALRRVLVERLGYARAEVRLLTERSETTHQAIVDALRHLVATAAPGDEVFFHYSGHGSQIPDEAELDGLAETLVPSDYVSFSDGSRDITDKELKALVEALRARSARVVLSFDCCHAGTITRAAQSGARGAGYAGSRQVRPQATAPPDDASGMLGRPAPAAAGGQCVVLSACRSDELAGQRYDAAGETVGLYSAALVEALGGVGVRSSWRDVHEVVRERLAADPQTPQIEGDIDLAVLGGACPPPPPYLAVRCEGTRVLLQAGLLQGITVATQVDIYGPGTQAFAAATPLATAEVAEVGLGSSVLELSAPGKGTLPSACRARIRRQGLVGAALRVDARALRELSGGDRLLEALRRMPVVCLAETPACDLLLVPTSAGLRLERTDGSLLAALGEALGERLAGVQLEEGWVRLEDRLRAIIEAEARRRFVAGLANSSPDALPVHVRLVGVEPRFVAGEAVGVQRVLGPIPTDRTVPAGTWARVEVWNAGYQEAYVTLLDAMPDGSVVQLWPRPDRILADESKLPNSVEERWQPLPDLLVRLLPTQGKETFKVLATDLPLQLAPVLDVESARAVRRDALPHLLDRLLQDATLGTRSGRDAIEPAWWGAASVSITVR